MSETTKNKKPLNLDDLAVVDESNGTIVVSSRRPKVSIPKQLPVLPLKGAVLFPGAILSIPINRSKSISLVEKAKEERFLFVAAPQLDDEVADPAFSDLCHYGTMCHVIKLVKNQDGAINAIVHGLERVELVADVPDENFLMAKVRKPREGQLTDEQKEEIEKSIHEAKKTIALIMEKSGNAGHDVVKLLMQLNDCDAISYFAAANLESKHEEKLKVLTAKTVHDRLFAALLIVSQRLMYVKVQMEIESKARKDLDKQQRDFLLQQQMRTIQDELGDNPQKNLIEKLKKAAADLKWSKEAQEAFDYEVERFGRMNTNAPEYSMTQSYLEVLTSLPWGKMSEDNHDLDNAERILNEHHYGLEKVKERIIEHLAVLKLKGNLKSPILCLYGPPGVGKTSLGKSIAEALGRKYVRMSLGGLHDESEIRGHRRTYVGAMPGRIIQCIKNAGTSNPVFILDEIDKVSSDFHGDPASALLEVLDPEQNSAFHDNYIDLDYDLSNVMFIATANNISTISGPLLDRMELIPVDGYLQEEKMEIAKQHLLPKEKEEHGLKPDAFSVSDESLAYIIDKYTRESGVRQLDKTLANLCRKVAVSVAKDKTVESELSLQCIRDLLGTEKYDHDIWHDDLRAGVVTGLAWTAVGGEILFIECAASKGKGKINLTGNLGDVMKESAILALEYIRSNAESFHLQDVNFDEINLHIHVPEGAVPKDGPSAGITMVSAIVSALSGRRAKKRIAMTGEITLRGMVIPVGGITEKILAAKRAGITDIILCEQNKKDIDDIKKEYVEGLTFHFVKRISEVIDLALEPK